MEKASAWKLAGSFLEIVFFFFVVIIIIYSEETLFKISISIIQYSFELKCIRWNEISPKVYSSYPRKQHYKRFEDTNNHMVEGFLFIIF